MSSNTAQRDRSMPSIKSKGKGKDNIDDSDDYYDGDFDDINKIDNDKLWMKTKPFVPRFLVVALLKYMMTPLQLPARLPLRIQLYRFSVRLNGIDTPD